MNDFTEPKSPRIAKWPFFAGDAILVAAAVLCYAQGQRWPFGNATGLQAWEGWVLTVCFAVGALLAVIPFILEYRVATRMEELERVQTGLQQIKNLEQVGRQISSATASWQAIQDDAGKAITSANELHERMNSEARSFQEFLQRANDTERSHLRLEVDKLRRSEAEWLQVTVRILDHVWALYRAAVRSGKVNLVGQLSLFQRACRDAAQRVGVVPFMPSAGELFDPELQQIAEGSEPTGDEPRVHEALATGFRFQGQLVRKALVVLQQNAGTNEPEVEADQSDFTRQLTSDFKESADTSFVQAMADEGLPSQPSPPEEAPPIPDTPTTGEEDQNPTETQPEDDQHHPNDLFRNNDDRRFR